MKAKVWLRSHIYVTSLQMHKDLPGLFDHIRGYAELFPGHSVSPAYPFSGFVLNVNVTTIVHRDAMDLSACLVIPFGVFAGGDLVLHEPGIVLPLRCGDAVVFQSCRISHFNLLYCGTRGSLVCHSDRAGLEWINDRLGWQKNVFLG